MLFRLDIDDKIKNSVSDDKWRIRCQGGDEEPIELLIMDVIGENWDGSGVSASETVAFLDANPNQPVNVRINSPGGMVYDGLTIYNALARREPTVTATVEGLAFSAASFIAMAADKVVMHEAADLGIHRASGVAIGNQNDMRSVAAWLNTIDEHLIEIYDAKTGAGREQIETWLDGTSDGTLFSAKEALEAGFADEVIPLAKGKHKALHQEQIAACAESYRSQAVRRMVTSRIGKQLTKEEDLGNI